MNAPETSFELSRRLFLQLGSAALAAIGIGCKSQPPADPIHYQPVLCVVTTRERNLCVQSGGNSVLMVTHNIDEAVLLADRIVILGVNPGSIRGELTVDIPRPRYKKGSPFRALVDHVYTVMTNPEVPVGPPKRNS